MKLKKAAEAAVSALMTMILYIFLHECGHMIVMLAAGSRITEFSILTAHVTSKGGHYTELTELWFNVNGALFPVVLMLVYALLYRQDTRRVFRRIFSCMAVLVPTVSLGAWIVNPVLYLYGFAPAGDDVTNFLNQSAEFFHPLWVSAAAAGLLAVCVFVIVKKGIVRNFIETMRRG